MQTEDVNRNNEKLDLRNCTNGQLETLLAELGQPKFRAKQIEDWVWVKNATSLDQMTNLSKALRAQLADYVTLGGVEEVARQVSQDGSRKYLLRFPDGVAVECVGMPSKNRLAVCVSTQAGCAMGCAFCATGASGLTRSLTAGEIYEQVMHVRDDFNTRVTSVVMMGQGEPMMNYDATLAALRRYVDKTGRRPTYEYALIQGVNDNEDELGALCDFCRGTLAHVNIIQLNEVPGSKLKPASPERAEEFVARLASVGVEATIRNSRGADIDAACGQLRQRMQEL